LKLETVSKDEIVPLSRVAPERLFLLRRRVSFDLRDPGSQGVPDLDEASIGT